MTHLELTGYITEDGELEVELPADVEPGDVIVTITRIASKEENSRPSIVKVTYSSFEMFLRTKVNRYWRLEDDIGDMDMSCLTVTELMQHLRDHDGFASSYVYVKGFEDEGKKRSRPIPEVDHLKLEEYVLPFQKELLYFAHNSDRLSNHQFLTLFSQEDKECEE